MLNRSQDGPTPESTAPAHRQSVADWFTAGRVLLLLTILCVLTCPKLLLGLHTLVYRDYGVLGYPFVFEARQSFWAGELPLWNPLSNCGAPFLAQWGTMALYPFSLIYLLFPLPWSLTYFCFAHLLLGGLGLYMLVNHWLQHRLAAAVAAVIYLFNGSMFSAMSWPNYLVALGWMPWIVLATHRAWQQGGRWIVTASLLAAFQLLVGTPEIVLLTWLVVGVLAVHALIQGTDPRRKLVLRLGTVAALAAGLIAVQFLPFVDLLLQSQRDGSFVSAKWPMPGWGWANLLVPLFNCFQTPQGPFFQFGQEFLTSYYLGVGALVLAFWAPWAVPQARVRILLALTLLSLILAMGDQGVLFTWVKQVFPVASVARYPVKFVLLTLFTVPILAAYAIRHLLSTPPAARRERSLLVLAGSAAALIVLILGFAYAYPYNPTVFSPDQLSTFTAYHWKATFTNGLVRLLFLVLITGTVLALARATTETKARTFGLLLITLLFLDVLTHTAPQNPTLPTAVMEPGLWQSVDPDRAPPSHGQGRVYITPEAEKKLLKSAVDDLHEDFLGKRLALWSNLNLLDQIPKINGSSTLQIREQSRVQDLIYNRAGPTNPPPTGLLRFLGVRYQSSPSNAVDWIPVTGSLPLATAGQQPRFADTEETLRALAHPAFDPEHVVYLPAELEKALSAEKLGQARVLSSEFHPNRIELEVEAEAPALLVLAQSFYPAWRATVDGARTPLWRANYAFQSLRVPAGRHRVRLAYQDNLLNLGLVITVCALAVCVVLWRAGRKGSA